MQYYHVVSRDKHPDALKIKPGQTIDTSDLEYNPFFLNTISGARELTLSDKNAIPILSFFKAIEQGELDIYEGLKSNKSVAHFAHIFLEGYIKLTRELIFESIRANEFGDRPSRQRCIWMTDSYEGAKYWQNRLPTRGANKTYLVETTGEAFKTNEGHLIVEAETYKTTEARARAYWNGIPSSGSTEFLFEGKIQFLKEVT